MTGGGSRRGRIGGRDVALARLPDGSGVILDTRGLTVLSLNATAAFLAERLLDGIADPAGLAAALAEAFAVDRPTAERDVQAFLAELESVLR